MRSVLILAVALLCGLALAPAANASRKPSTAERDAIAQVVGQGPGCLDILISTVDETWAVQGSTNAPACQEANGWRVLRLTDTGWVVVTEGGGDQLCPVEGVPADVGADLEICRDPAREVYLPVGGKLKQYPSSIRLPNGATVRRIGWSTWGPSSARGQGRYQRGTGGRSRAVTIRLSGRKTCARGRRIFTRLALSGSAAPYRQGVRWATCSQVPPASSSWTEADVMNAAGLTTEDGGITYQTKSGCSVAVVLNTAAEVNLYASAGDTVVTNPSRTAGLKVVGASPACIAELRGALAKLK